MPDSSHPMYPCLNTSGLATVAPVKVEPVLVDVAQVENTDYATGDSFYVGGLLI